MTTQPTFRRIGPVSGDAVSAVRLRESSWQPLTAVGSVLAFLLLLVSFGPAAASNPQITIELNRLEDVPNSCRLSFVLTNGLTVPVDALTIETVLFDQNGRVDRFLLLKARPLPVGKTRVQQFDVGQASCGAIGRVLLNDVTECAGEALGPAICLSAIKTDSKTEVPFVSTMSPSDEPANAAPANRDPANSSSTQ